MAAVPNKRFCVEFYPGEGKIQHKIACSERRPFVLNPTGFQHKTFGFAYVGGKSRARISGNIGKTEGFVLNPSGFQHKMAAVSNKRFCVEFIGLGVFLGTGFTSSCRGLCVESQDVRTTQVLC